MIKKYRIDGLDCPNCARSLENALNGLDSIKSAHIDFVKSSITIESDDEAKALADAMALTKRIELDACIIAEKHISKKNKSTLLFDLCLLTAGIALAIIVFTVKMPTWEYWTMFVTSALLMGYKTYFKAVNLLFKGVVNENLLVTISIVGATAVGEHFDGLMVVALYSIGKLLESLALNKSKRSIEALTNIKPEFAVVVRNGEEIRVSPSDIKVGDIIVVRAGEKVAVDGVVEKGEVNLNTQSLTGESLPQFVRIGDEVLSGSIVVDGVLQIRAKTEYTNSTVNKILNLIENASDKKAKTETFISKISKWYTLGVMALAIMVWGIVWAVTKNIDTAIYRGLIFLVISCPCAFAISVPLAYFSGIGNASRNGILIKGSNYLDALAKLDCIAFDKTGTLTTCEFEITGINIFDKNYTNDDIIYLASLGEQYSLHPLAKAIIKHNTRPLEKIDGVKEIAGEGVYFDYNGEKYFVGRKSKDIDGTVVELFKGDKLIANISLSDTIKSTAKPTIYELKNLGVKTVMLSGDNGEVVSKVASELGLDESYAKLLPEDKFKWIETNKSKTNTIGYVGDGINDAPSLTLADVGISMGLGGAEASIEASDIVIANDNPAKIVDGIKISKVTRKIVWQNIIISAVIKATFLTLGAFGVTGMLSAVIADVGVTLLAILNSLRALNYSPNKNNKNNKCEIKK